MQLDQAGPHFIFLFLDPAAALALAVSQPSLALMRPQNKHRPNPFLSQRLTSASRAQGQEFILAQNVD